jgi:xanthine/uracil/vitamin C permease (AzgA family)
MVGVYSLSNVRDINYEDFVDLLTAFFTIATMGFTYSIANGICAGFIFFSWMRTVRWVQLKVCTYFNKPEYESKEGLETELS